MPIKKAVIILKDNAGNSERMNETEDGVYQTSARGIQGQIGNSYHIEITTTDGRQFESEPDELLPVGKVDSIYYKYQARESGDVFRIFANVNGVLERDNLLRIRMVATYKIETFPQFRTKPAGSPFVVTPDPFPCSGYAYTTSDGLQKIGNCECCTCWITIHDNVPVVVNDNFVSNAMFTDVEVGTIPITPDVFYEKVHVEIQQLSLTPNVYTYWELVRTQKLGVADIFQPPSARLVGNIKGVNSDQEVLGIFWAAGVAQKSIFIDKKDEQIPYLIREVDRINRNVTPCHNLNNSSTESPSFWE